MCSTSSNFYQLPSLQNMSTPDQSPYGNPNQLEPVPEPEPEPEPETETVEPEQKESQLSRPLASTKDTNLTSSSNTELPYTIPPWSGAPRHGFFLHLLKDGATIDKFKLHEKGCYVFGSMDLCDFTLDDPAISPFHAVLQFKSEGAAYIYDLGSKHGTSVNNNQVNQREYVELHVGDAIQFGRSPLLYVLEGPIDLIPTGNGNGDESAMAVATQENQDQLAASLNDLFNSVSTMVKGELQGTNNLLELLEKMNLRVAKEYKGFGDLASGLSVFVEQLKSKSDNFDEYVQQIDAIENQVTEFEAVISMLDRYVSTLESKVQSAYQIPPH